MQQGQCPLGKGVMRDANGRARPGSWTAETNDVIWKLQVKSHLVGRHAAQAMAEVLGHVPGMEGVSETLRNANASGEELGQRDFAGRALLKGDRAAQFWLAEQLLAR